MNKSKLGLDFQDQLYYQLNSEELTIKEGEYLEDIMTEIPTNTILSKTLPGLGATTLEIKSKRHSIIIEPNVPVIKGKVQKHKKDNLFGVYEGITTDNVIDYLLKPLSKGQHKKLMTTPESFFKIKNAMNTLGIDWHNDYMLLFDECDKIIKDVNYRSSIILPLDDFFHFKNKAFVSATPILPSDPRFEDKNFEVIKIKPDFEYKKTIQLITTNNVVANFRAIINMCKDRQPIWIPLNSTDTINSIINKFGLIDEAHVFCSQDSVDKLKGINNNIKAYSNLPLDNKGKVKSAKYNFFTSRFFSAVDIELDYKPIVLIISDLHYAEHSMIDPHTEAIQIVGRFRNGVNTIIHLSNINYKMQYKTPEQLISYLDGCHEIYCQLHTLFTSATDEGVKATLKEALERVSYARFLDEKGNRNYFHIDNYFDEERVKGFYRHQSFLVEAYQNSHFFELKYQHISLPLGDDDKLKIHRADNKKARRLIIIEQLDLLSDEKGDYDEPLLKDFRDSLHKEDSLIVEAYEELGKDTALKYITSDKNLNLALIKHRSDLGLDRFAIMSSVYAVFSEHKKYKVNYIKSELRKIYSSFGDDTAYPTKKIEEFFKIENYDARKNGQRAYLLGNKLF